MGFFGSTVVCSRGSQKKAEVMAMYTQLVRNPESGFISCRASRWRLIWAQVHRVKEHLHQSGLIHGPRDDNDLFYHIPALEDGLKNFLAHSRTPPTLRIYRVQPPHLS